MYRYNRRVCLVAATSVIYLFALFGCSSGRALASVNKPAPKFELQFLNGKPVRLADYSGKIVMIHFWASWCSLCVHELDTLQNLYRFLGRSDFEILAIAVDDKREAVTKLQGQRRYSFPLILDQSGDVRDAYKVSDIPQTLLVGRNGEFLAFSEPKSGEIVTRAIGPQKWDSETAAMSLLATLDR